MDVPATSTTASLLSTDFRVDNTTTSTAVDVRKGRIVWRSCGYDARAGGANLSTSAANGTYSFGAGAASLVNNGASGLTGLRISYNVEKYRYGSNANGFRIHSSDGTAWTSAGDSFKTAFAADANNNAFATLRV